MNNSFFTKAFSALLIVILALAFMPVTPARAATLIVNTNAGGAVAVNGLCSLREAIINANNDAATNIDCAAGTGADIIQFSAAVSTITVTAFALPAITDPDGLSIDGGGVVTVDGGGAFRIFNVNGGAFTVQNITLSNGQAAAGNGGAILYAGGVGLTVSSSTFNTNRTTAATGLGGAIYHTTGTLSITNSTFDGNYTGSNGGAVYIANGTGTMTITNSAFTNQNNATLNDGAALYLALGTLEINGGNFTGNSTAGGNGGAIFKNGGSLTVGNTSSVSFINNSSSGNGGAISSHNGGTLIVTGTFTGNSGSFGGALFYLTSAGTFTVSNSTFTNNTAVTGNAGAIRSGGNLTLTNSTFTNNSAALNGGAIWHTTNSLAISGSTFDGNYTSALGDGGAIYLVSASGTATVDNTNFTNQNNAGIDDGAGLYIDGIIPGGAIVEINGGAFTGNTATGNGGGIAVGANGTLTIGNTSGVTFTNNTAGGGGAIYHNGISTFSISDSTFQNNTALNGGAMLIADPLANLNVSNSTFTGNTAVDDGGAIVNNANPATITNSLFQNNSVTGISPNNDGGAIQNTLNADGTTIRLSSFIGNSTTNTNDNNARGGAIANSGANFVLANVTFSGNSANETAAVAGNAQGGAVWSDDNATIHNVTFSGNSVSDTGTGVADGGNLFQNAGTLTVANSILNGGTENGAAGNCGGIITDGGNNISFSAADCGAGFTNSDPLLGGLTGSPAYYPLNAGSPAINTGSNAICATAATTNNQSQNGLTRPQGANCDIGSYEAPATITLTLQKTVLNNNGGTALDTAWTLSATGPTNISGVEGNAAVTNAVVSAGNYTLSESVVSGYSNSGVWSCSGFTSGSQTDDDTLTLGAGDNVTCVITNDDISPILTLVKTVISDNGGTALDTAWTLNAAGPTPISGAEGAVAVTGATVDAGNYTLTEAGGPAGYTQTGLTCSGAADLNPADGLAIALGETITCTFTNNDVAPTLTLVKTVTNNNGGTATDIDWTLNAAGPTPISGTEGDVSITNATVNAGNYTLTETLGPSGYTQTGIACSGSDVNGADGLTLLPGETVTCTFANNDIASTLTLAKTVVIDNGGTATDTDWTLNAAGPTPISGVEGAATVTNAAVDAGNYTLTETGGPAGYTQTGLTCSGAADLNPNDGLNIGVGETITCTFTNNDIAPTLTLVKDVTNNDGGTNVISDWTLTANGPSTISGSTGTGAVTNAIVDAGSYSLGESAIAGYTQTAITCSGNDANGADGLDLDPGENVTCTFFNDDIGAILTLLKDVTNDNGGLSADTAWTLNATGPTTISGVEGAAAVTGAGVSAGNYTLTESGGPSGYTQTNLTCSGAADGNPNDGLTIALGEVITCTFTNNDVAPTLTLVKNVTNNDGGTAVIGDWTLDATGPSAINGVTGAGAVTNAVVDAGSYSLSETGPAGYTQTAITCSGNDANGADGLDLDPGENVTCTFFNDDIGATLTLLKDVTNDNIGTAVDTDWTLTATGPTTISGVEGTAPVTGAGVSAGNYVLTESGPANYTQTANTCVGGTDANGADGLSLALGETVTCTFFNDDDVPVLLVPNVNSTPDTGDGSIAEGEVILNTLNISKLTVQFNWDADNPVGITDTDDVNNPNNYILLYSTTGTFNTPSCAVVAGGGVVAPDIRIPVTSVAYSNGGGSGPFIATLTLSTPLTNIGDYRLFVCGTTSIVLAADPTVVLSGNGTPGTDFTRNFRINADPGNGGGGTPIDDDDELTVAALPATGFAPNRVTILAEQPKELAYTSLGDLWIEIPALGVKSSIVGVPQTKEAEWNVTWLANNVGWLNGTAFPTWEGNSVLTAHVTNADGLGGPFANLTKLKFGDQIIVHAFGQKYIFELRNSRMVKPFSTSFAFEDLEDESYLTLITCQVYLPKSDTYLYRRVIRAVLVKIETE
jgi:LPXTG-site transpeptidase (sortase) family protein